MKSGLYAWAGASATASAAACAKRFDEPMMNVSNVYFWLSPTSDESPGWSSAGSRSCLGAVGGRRRRR